MSRSLRSGSKVQEFKKTPLVEKESSKLSKSITKKGLRNNSNESKSVSLKKNQNKTQSSKEKKIVEKKRADSSNSKQKSLPKVKKEPIEEPSKIKRKSPQPKVVKTTKVNPKQKGKKTKEAKDTVTKKGTKVVLKNEPKKDPLEEIEIKKEKIEEEKPSKKSLSKSKGKKGKATKEEEKKIKKEPIVKIKKEEISEEEEEEKKSKGKKNPPKKKEEGEAEVEAEIDRLIKKIEDKKKTKKSNVTFLGKKRAKKEVVKPKKLKAKDYKFILQKSPELKREHLIDLNDLSKRKTISPSDQVLALIEIGYNAVYYKFAFSTHSLFFWEDVLNYHAVGKIFEGFKADTLKKYWNTLAKIDPFKLKFEVEKQREYFDSVRVKMMPITTSLSLYFQNKIENIQEYLERNETDSKKDTKPGAKERKRYESGSVRSFERKENPNEDLINEIWGLKETKTPTEFQKLLLKGREEKEDKGKSPKKGKKKSMTEEDKASFKQLDKMVDRLAKKFPNYDREYIAKLMAATSMNIPRTYKCLVDEDAKKKFAFTDLDDEVILKMKGSKSYEKLVKEKGEKLVNEREAYLKA